jgi:hypothetical protein
VNKTNRRNEFQFYWYYDSACFGQSFCPSSGVLSRTNGIGTFYADLMTVCHQKQDGISILLLVAMVIFTISWIKYCIINLLQGIWITLNLKGSVFLCKSLVWIIFRCSFEIAGWTVLHTTWISWGIPFPPLCVKSARDLRQLDPWTQQFPFLFSTQSSSFPEDFTLIFWFV